MMPVRRWKSHSTFYVPDDYAAGLAASHPEHFQWVASIHPYDPQALERLDAAAARGARAIKWLPSAQNIDPADARCDRFYARLAELQMPLIAHAGDERAVNGFGEHLGNPLRLRRPLDAGRAGGRRTLCLAGQRAAAMSPAQQSSPTSHSSRN